MGFDSFTFHAHFSTSKHPKTEFIDQQSSQNVSVVHLILEKNTLPRGTFATMPNFEHSLQKLSNLNSILDHF